MHVDHDRFIHFDTERDAVLTRTFTVSRDARFRTPGLDVHVHVLSFGSPEIERYLRFREALRTTVLATRRSS